MTGIIRRQKKVADLVLGDMYVDYAMKVSRDPQEEWAYGPASRVLDIKKKGDQLLVILASGVCVLHYPGHLVVVEEYA